jgi:hypothetical protein
MWRQKIYHEMVIGVVQNAMLHALEIGAAVRAMTEWVNMWRWGAWRGKN